MAERASGLTYEDLLEMFPEESNRRRELIGGELIVPPAPTSRHQRVSVLVVVALHAYEREHGGAVAHGPDVYLTERDVVEPDVVFLRPEHLERVEEAFVRGAPDLVVEVVASSRGELIDTVVKRYLYERHAVPECWYLDLDIEEMRLYRLANGRYGAPSFLRRGDVLESEALPGFSASVDDLLGRPEG